jgi:hypothetical protein
MSNTDPPDNSGFKEEAPPTLPPDIKTEWVYFSPASAKRIIAVSKYNRQESKAHWMRIARDIQNGKWDHTGETIKFNGNLDEPGMLEDGFHRLMAIAESGIGLWMLVATGVPHSAMHKEGSGRPRSLAQRFKIDGEKDAPILAELIKYLTLYRNVGAFSGEVYTASEQYEILDREPGTRPFAAECDRKMPERWLRKGLLACCWYLFAEKDAAVASKFCEQIITGAGLAVGDPAHSYRDWLSRLDDKNRKSQVIGATLIDCWCRFRRGERVNRVRAQKDILDIE